MAVPIRTFSELPTSGESYIYLHTTTDRKSHLVFPRIVVYHPIKETQASKFGLHFKIKPKMHVSIITIDTDSGDGYIQEIMAVFTSNIWGHMLICFDATVWSKFGVSL